MDMANLAPKSGGKAPEKSNFAQTCNLLSQFLKGRGSLGDISLGINQTSGAPATTLNLLPNMENSSETAPRQNLVAPPNTKSIDFFPQFPGYGIPSSTEDIANKVDLRKSAGEPRTAPMTIFYGGKVMVFDGFPADKAKEIMDLARKGIDLNKSAPELSDAPAQERPQLQREADGPDMRLAPRTSLRRFFERRKERVASKAPYQMNSPSRVPSSPKSEERNTATWLDLEQQSSRQLDLNL